MNTNEYVTHSVTLGLQTSGKMWSVDSRLCLEDGFYSEAIEYQKIASAFYAAARQLQGIK